MKNDHENYAWIDICPICRQGRQLIAREARTRILYILCEECESEWRSPSDARDIDSALRDTFGESTPLTREELAEHPWSAFLEGTK